MPKLKNEQYEAFAVARAQGTARRPAFETAGFKWDKGNAARLEKRPEVAARIAELRGERRQIVPLPEPAKLIPLTDAPQNLTEAGYNPIWFADAYRRLAAAAEEAGQYNHAVTALAKIQGMYESEAKDPEATRPQDSARIDINALGSVLDKVAHVIAASKAPDHSAPDAGDTSLLTLPEQKARRAAADET